MATLRCRGRWHRPASAAGALLVSTIAAVAMASQTISYEYDARGRLTKVVRTDSATNAKTVTDYQHDKADNRTLRETKTGQ